MAGRLFRELAQDLAKEFGPCILYTGHPDALQYAGTEKLTVIKGPAYNKRSLTKRFVSWFLYFLFAFFKALSVSKQSLLFFSTSPPFLSFIGYINKKLFRKRYVVLVYDIYPEIPIALGWLKADGVISKIWRWINRLSYENSEGVFTIGEYMAQNLAQQFDPQKTKFGQIEVVPPWVDTDLIKPIKKSENWFAIKYRQVDKFTILYSGNIGATHDVNFIIELAKRFRNEKKIQLLIVGNGYKRGRLERSIKDQNLTNLLLLFPQPENALPYSFATGDLALITIASGIEGYMLPSRMPCFIAAGCPILYNGSIDSEIGAFCSKSSSEAAYVCNNVDEAEKVIISLLLSKNYKSAWPHFDLRNQFSRKRKVLKFIDVIEGSGILPIH